MNVFRSGIDVLRAALSEASYDIRGVVVASAMLMLLSVGPEQHLADDAGILTIASLASFVAQYWLTRRAMARDGLRLGRGVVALYFGMCLISTLAILAGLILLVLPGLWLAARWIAAGPVLFCEDVGAIEALGRSVALTKGQVVSIMIALALASIPVLLVLTWMFLLDEYGLLTSIIANAGFTASQLLFWYVAVAVYRTAAMPVLQDA